VDFVQAWQHYQMLVLHRQNQNKRSTEIPATRSVFFLVCTGVRISVSIKKSFPIAK
jgi:hypothetical protein